MKWIEENPVYTIMIIWTVSLCFPFFVYYSQIAKGRTPDEANGFLLKWFI